MEKWDFYIQPHGSVLSLKLGEVWRYRDLLRMYRMKEQCYGENILVNQLLQRYLRRD